MTCPSLAKRVPIGLSKVGGLLGTAGVGLASGVGVGVGDGVGVGAMLLDNIMTRDDCEKVDWTIVVVVKTSITEVVEGETHIKSFAPSPVAIHISSGSIHGLGIQGEIEMLHSRPVKPGGHSQTNIPNGRSMHVALLRQGFGSQSSMSTEQSSPVKP